MWGLAFSSPALRGLEKLPPRVAEAVLTFISSTLLSNPERLSKPLHRELEGTRSARRGDYRVLFELNHETHTLIVTRIAHRADVYKPR